MFVITFYSYKGGVGRTLALMNAASRLVRKGKRVMVMDFDLEAPGVEFFSQSSPGPRPGLVEYIGEFISTGKVPDLADYVYTTSLANGPEILLMPAGRGDSNYQMLLSHLDWKVFYREKKGFLFIENLKGAIKERFQPDYLLVDSRTGLTDISGICTLQLPNLVVLLFNLNNQNVHGTAHISQSIRNNKFKRPVELLLVATPVPDVPDYVGIRRDRLQYAQQTIGVPIDAIIPFDPFVSFRETVITGDEATYLGRAYDALAEAIIGKNKTDTLNLLAQANKLRDEGHTDLAELRYHELIETYPTFSDAWLQLGLLDKTRGDLQSALSSFQRVRQLQPSNLRVISQLATTSLALRDHDSAVAFLREYLTVSVDEEEIQQLALTFERHGLDDAAQLAFNRSNEVNESPFAHIGIGETWMRMGQLSNAAKHYERAAAMAPMILSATYNAGYILAKLGDPRFVDYYRRAEKLFEGREESGESPAAEANTQQAMSNVYFALGRVERARECLIAALNSAANVRKGTIFSSIQYREVSQDKFIAETKQMLSRYPQLTAKQ